MKPLITYVLVLGTLITLSQGAVSPLLTWPLVDTSYAKEIVENPTAQTDNDQCGFVFDNSFPLLSNKPLLLTNSHVDLQLQYADPNVVEINDMSVSLFINPTSSANGCILHYKHDGPTPAGFIKEMKFFLNSGNIALNLTHDVGVDDYLTLTSFTVGTGSWYLVQFGRDVSNGKITLRAGTVSGNDAQEIAEDNNFQNNLKLRLPGTIRLGAAIDNSLSHFSGGITCLAVFSDKAPVPEVDVVSACSVSYTQVTGNPSANCNAYEHHDSAYFELNGRDRVPGGATVELSTLTSCGKVISCGAYCLQNELCVSFAVENASDDCKMCKLYDRNDYTNQITSIGMNYYIRLYNYN